MFSMSWWALVTATITVTASHREQILMARILNCKLFACLDALLKNIDVNRSRCLRWHGTFSSTCLSIRDCTHLCSWFGSWDISIQFNCKIIFLARTSVIVCAFE